MNILLVEPFLGGSHAQWALGLKEHSQHHIDIIGLPDRFWKWRMYGAAVTLADQVRDSIHNYDLVMASDMLDLPAFLGLTRFTGKTALYFHESQWLYPWSPIDQDKDTGRDYSYGFLNYRSAISADAVFFNSHFHQQTFLETAPIFLRKMPDYELTEWVTRIRSKSSVLYPGLELVGFDDLTSERSTNTPVILWNHRWEFDKDPYLFLKGLDALSAADLDFHLILLGDNQDKQHPVYHKIMSRYCEHIIHSGFVNHVDQYRVLLNRSDIIPVTSQQDFFGISTLEAMYAGAYPLLPDRLAFPEHIPPEITNRYQYFYDEDEDFPGKLTDIIQQGKWKEYDNAHIKKWVSRYDWRNVIGEYDRSLRSINST